MIGFLLVASLMAADFGFKEVRVYTQGDRILLDADIEYRLNEVTIEALENGIPLTFETHVQIRRKGAWIWEGDIIETRLRSLLRFHPISSLFEIYDLESGEKDVFATRGGAIEALGIIRALSLIEREMLEPGKTYNVRLQTKLDIEALPLPLRPVAHLSPDWHLKSDAWEWQLKP